MKVLPHILLLTVSVFPTSCHPYTPPRELTTISTGYTVAYIEVTPWELRIGNGDIEYVYVRIFDLNRNPIPNRIVNASIEEPFVAIIDDTAITNPDGLAVFKVTGLGFPAKSTIRFTSDGVSYTLDVWDSWYKAFAVGGY